MSEDEKEFEKIIVLDAEYSIRKDYKCWTLQYKKPIPKKTNPNEMREHYDASYHPTLENALQFYADKRMKKAGSVPEAIELLKDAMKQITKLTKHYPHALSKEFTE